MNQVSPVLRRAEGKWVHWCPGCLHMHPLPDSWRFDGDVNCPTFAPSFRQMGQGGVTLCHYNVTKGRLIFHADSPHGLAGQTVPMSPIPADLADFDYL